MKLVTTHYMYYTFRTYVAPFIVSEGFAFVPPLVAFARSDRTADCRRLCQSKARLNRGVETMDVQYRHKKRASGSDGVNIPLARRVIISESCHAEGVAVKGLT